MVASEYRDMRMPEAEHQHGYSEGAIDRLEEELVHKKLERIAVPITQALGCIGIACTRRFKTPLVCAWTLSTGVGSFWYVHNSIQVLERRYKKLLELQLKSDMHRLLNTETDYALLKDISDSMKKACTE